MQVFKNIYYGKKTQQGPNGTAATSNLQLAHAIASYQTKWRFSLFLDAHISLSQKCFLTSLRILLSTSLHFIFTVLQKCLVTKLIKNLAFT